MTTTLHTRAGLLACALSLGLAQAAPLAGTLAPASPLAPQTTPQATAEPTLADAIEQAWQRAIQAAQARSEAAQALAGQAQSAPWLAGAPSLSLSHRSDRWHQDRGQNEQELALALPLWWPGQRGARQAEAAASLGAADQRSQALRWQLATEVRLAAWGLQGAQQALQASEQALAQLQALSQDVSRRVRAGDLAPADEMAAQAEALAAHKQVLAQQLGLQQALASWQQLTGLASTPAMPDVQPAPTPPPAQATGPDGTIHPEALLAERDVAVAEARLAAARHPQMDAPELSIGLRRDVAAQGSHAERSLTLGLRLPLGTEARQQGPQRIAQAELALARTQQARTLERLHTERALAEQGLQAAQAQLASDTARCALLAQRATLIAQAFRAGEAALPDLLRAMDATHQAQAELARQRAATGQAQARLHHAQGTQP